MNNITIIGFLAAICTTSAFLPQAIKIIKTRKTSDISLLMYSVMGIGIFLWLLYGIFLNEMPIIMANSISIILVGCILILKIKYKWGCVQKNKLQISNTSGKIFMQFIIQHVVNYFTT